METISDINLRIAEIIYNSRMVTFTKKNNHKLINKNESGIKAKHLAFNKKEMIYER